MKIVNYFLAVAAITAMVSCDNSDEKSDYTFINATSDSTTVYFSFEKDKVVAVTNGPVTEEWDIAFYRYNIKTNGGESGPGLGGALCAYETNFDKVTEAPATGYESDDSLMITTGFNPVTHMPSFGRISGNWLLTGNMPNPYAPETDTVSHVWSHTYSGQTTTMVPTQKVFVIKTARGKYAKIQVLDYYKQGVSGYIKWRYYFQADGNRKFGK